MRKYLLPQTGTFFKANLHCHSTISDGTWTPERIKEEYKKQGYSIVAYTDHNKMVNHADLCDDSFLAMNGYEIDINAPGEVWGLQKTCHTCFVALSPDLQKQDCFDFKREYSHACISEMMKRGRREGYFVTYNHPAWSLQDYSDYMGYEGMHAMEMVNYGCVEAGYEDYNPQVYDDMLRGGKRIYCIATDDNHNCRNDSFGGFTVIKAETLDYAHIADALVKGHFYASEGPQITALWVEDNKVHIECLDAVKIAMVSGIIHAGSKYGTEEQPLTSAEFELSPKQKYFRLVVTDKKGKHACTNAYFLDEL